MIAHPSRGGSWIRDPLTGALSPNPDDAATIAALIADAPGTPTIPPAANPGTDTDTGADTDPAGSAEPGAQED